MGFESGNRLTVSAVIVLALNWHKTSVMALLIAAEISGFCKVDKALAVLMPCALDCWLAVSEYVSARMGTAGCVFSALKTEDIRICKKTQDVLIYCRREFLRTTATAVGSRGAAELSSSCVQRATFELPVVACCL